MAVILLLDSGPLGLLTDNPRKPTVARALSRFHAASIRSDIVIPEIADYEVRRELLRVNSKLGLASLDALKRNFAFAPITTAVMQRAAAFWAEARRGGRPTSDRHALDGDVILAAQATLLGGPGDSVMVATTNVGHLARFVKAVDWTTVD